MRGISWRKGRLKLCGCAVFAVACLGFCTVTVVLADEAPLDPQDISILTESGVVYPGDVSTVPVEVRLPMGLNCNNPDPTPLCAGQIGIQGGFIQECPDCVADLDGDLDVGIQDLLALLALWGEDPGGPPDFDGSGDVGIQDLLFLLAEWGACGPGPEDSLWTGLAFPFMLGSGVTVDTVEFTLNTNNGGGDIYITGNTDVSGDCQPDVTDILAQVCCALDGQGTGALSVTFDPVETTDEITWVVIPGRTGMAGLDGNGLPNGGTAPSNQVARDDTAVSSPNQAFANLIGTGNPGDWTDLDTLGCDSMGLNCLGTPYCINLTFTGGQADSFDCANPPNSGACCVDDGANGACEGLRNWECGVAGGLYNGDASSCDNPPVFSCNCGALAGGCLVGNGSPGCIALGCCEAVCLQDNFCCDVEWDSSCADIALQNIAACLPDLGDDGPVDLATGSDESVNGYLRVGVEGLGANASTTFGGTGDWYNPGPGGAGPGDPAPAEVTFSSGTWVIFDLNGDGVYDVANDEMEQLSRNSQYLGIGCFQGDELLSQTLTDVVASDEMGGDGVNDTATSTFRVRAPDADLISVHFSLAQQVYSAGNNVAVFTQTYEITNETANTISFELLRQVDADLVWDDAADFGDDNVGTGSNGCGALVDTFVYQSEWDGGLGQPMANVALTLSSPQADAYTGSRNTMDCDGAGGPCGEFGYGTDSPFCGGLDHTGDGVEDLGMPECYANSFPSGTDTCSTGVDGDSTDNPGGTCGTPCDGSIYLRVPVSLAPAGESGDSMMVVIDHTYGATTPRGDSCN